MFDKGSTANMCVSCVGNSTRESVKFQKATTD